MGITSSTPDVPGAPGIEREETTPSPAPPDEGPALAGPRKAGTVSDKAGIEEDWTSMATGDPAFWLKQ